MERLYIDRFWSKVIKTDNNEDCWNWNAAVSESTGYGKFRYKNKAYDAHRFVYQMLYGEINNSKLLVCHKCNNRLCVNPNHLYLGTAKDNVHDMIRAGNMFSVQSCAHVVGSKCSSAKLNEQLVLEMRKRYEEKDYKKVKDLYDEYGISKSTFRSIINREYWKHI